MDRDTDDLAIVLNASDVDTAEFDEVWGKSRATPFELQLMAAAFRWAIFEKDLRWINDDNNPDYVFSFQTCCASLGINYQAARKVLNERLGKCCRLFFRHPKPKLEFEISDVPGKEYSHPYRQCPPGVNPSRCRECRQRYNFGYAQRWRQSSQSRTAIMARLAG